MWVSCAIGRQRSGQRSLTRALLLPPAWTPTSPVSSIEAGPAAGQTGQKEELKTGAPTTGQAEGQQALVAGAAAGGGRRAAAAAAVAAGPSPPSAPSRRPLTCRYATGSRTGRCRRPRGPAAAGPGPAGRPCPSERTWPRRVHRDGEAIAGGAWKPRGEQWAFESTKCSARLRSGALACAASGGNDCQKAGWRLERGSVHGTLSSTCCGRPPARSAPPFDCEGLLKLALPA